MSVPDQWLIDRVLAQDCDAFAELVRRHERLVAHMVFRMVAEPRDREELCQDVFLRVYQRLHLFEGRSKLSTWIARIAYRTCLNHLEKRPPNWVALDDAEAAEIETSSDTSAVDALMTDELNAFVRASVQRLPPAYRAAVTLVYLDDMTVAEVSEVLEMPEGTVKSHLFRARRLLRQWLLEQYSPKELER